MTKYVILRQTSDHMFELIGEEEAGGRRKAVNLALADRDQPEVGTIETFKAIPESSWASVVMEMEQPAARLRLFSETRSPAPSAAPAPTDDPKGEPVNDPEA